VKYSAVLFDWGNTLARTHQGLLPFVSILFRELFESGYRLGVLSNSDRYGDARWLRRQFGKHDLVQYIECIMGTGGALGATTVLGSRGCHKPHAESFHRVLDFMHIPANRVVYVGDSFKNDILATGSLGMGSLHVNAHNEDWSKRLWMELGDNSSQKRFNLLTSYSVVGNSIIINLRHLTEPVKRGDRIIIGLDEHEVLDCDPSHQDKDDDIVHGKSDVMIRIKTRLV